MYKKTLSNITNAIFTDWLGLGFLFIFIITWISGDNNRVFIGFLALAMAVLFMNGLAQLDMIIDEKYPSWWKNSKIIHFFHHIHGEGELAGIWVGIILFVFLLSKGEANQVHLPIYGALALSGIMAAANIATSRIIPLMNQLEKIIGVWGAAWIGSMFSTLTGAASSVFVCEYLKERVDEKNKPEVALRLSAGIGLGNGLLPFVAPPVLIVWSVLENKLGWNLSHLFLYVGLIGVIYSGFITYKIKKLTQNIIIKDTTKVRYFSIELLALIVVIIGNVLAYTTDVMLIINILITVAAIYLGKDFNSKWQPLILGVLLIALEVIGHTSEPFVSKLIETALPKDINILFLGIILFFISSWTSHIADNALTSRILIGTLIGMTFSATQMSFLASSVLIGALFGGFLLIPANIPNFPIAKILKIESGVWLRAGLKIYWTFVVPVVWIVGLYFIIVK